MGSIKAALGPVNLPAPKPDIELQHSGLKVLLKWTRERGTDALRIEAANATGSFIHAQDDTSPHFLDDHPSPRPGLAAIRKYRPIYLKDGQSVGSFGDCRGHHRDRNVGRGGEAAELTQRGG